MRNRWLALLAGIALFFVVAPLSATPTPEPLFNECPQVGQAIGCSYLIDFGTRGSVNVLFDQNVKNVDSQGDILIGILNNSGSYISLAGFTGPNNFFSGIQLTGGLGNGKSTYFEWTDPYGDGKDNGDCDDKDWDSKSCKCDDKDWDSKSCEDGGGTKNPTPEPGSIMLLGTGLVVLGGVLRRKLLP